VLNDIVSEILRIKDAVTPAESVAQNSENQMFRRIFKNSIEEFAESEVLAEQLRSATCTKDHLSDSEMNFTAKRL